MKNKDVENKYLYIGRMVYDHFEDEELTQNDCYDKIDAPSKGKTNVKQQNERSENQTTKKKESGKSKKA